MKTPEETRKAKERILAAALSEFGSKSYDAASINRICEAGKIPKGLVPPGICLCGFRHKASAC